MNISVIIPSYNTQDSIEDTLLHLVQQKIDVECEIIVVDCSEHNLVEQIVERIKESSVKLRYIYKKERFNPGEGRNIGAREAWGSLLIFIDADVALAPGSLQAAWNHFTAGKQIFGGALELDTSVNSSFAAYIEHYFFNHESQRGRPECERKNLSSALMFFDREIFIQEGGFKDIPRMQDTELTERLRRQGHHLFFCPDVLAFQKQDSPLPKVLKKIYINGQNLYYIRYHNSMSLVKRVVFFIVLPLITIIKMGRIIIRHLVYQPPLRKLIMLAIGFPLLVSGFFWMAGFYNALITEKGISAER
ncbi:MAG: glycosyl transferase family 2 [Spirochaetae bacterium HGW-Spirochaetae-1]|jgi:GT2 family glycosyltransferase|nr:MAG: glycosyl transferase family 2 [Spirochaetae bacterium HGW-Spirochaetae-1]